MKKNLIFMIIILLMSCQHSEIQQDDIAETEVLDSDLSNQDADDLEDIVVEDTVLNDQLVNQDNQIQDQFPIQNLEKTPNKGKITWIGYDYNYADNKLSIEIKYHGEPAYSLSQEINKSNQPELVLSFVNSTIRSSLKKDLIAEEFAAPVGYIRSRDTQNTEMPIVDVFLTLRDAVQPYLYSEKDRIVLEYKLATDSKLYSEHLKAVGSAQLLSANISPQTIVGRAPLYDISSFRQPSVAPVPIRLENLPRHQDHSSSPVVNPAPIAAEANVDDKIIEALEQPVELLDISNNENLNAEAINLNQTTNYRMNTNQAQINNQSTIDQGAIEEIELFEEQNNLIQNQGESKSSQAVIANPLPSINTSKLPAAQLPQNGFGPNVSKSAPIQKSDIPTTTQPQLAPTQPSLQQNPQSIPEFEESINDFDSEDQEVDFEEEMFEVRVQHFGFMTVSQANIQDVNSLLLDAVNSTTSNAVSGNAAKSANSSSIPLPEVEGSDSMTQKPSYVGKTLDLDFRGAPLIEVVKLISQESGVNFTFPPAIGDTPIFVNFKNVAWDLALRAVLESSSLGMVEIAPNLVRIDNIARLATETEAIERAKRTAERLIPTKVLVFRLSYASPSEVATTIRSMLQSIGGTASSLSDSRFRVEVDTRTNSLIVEATPKQLEKIKVLVDRLDLQTPQVEIASRIIEVSSDLSDELGIRWAGTFNLDPSNGLGFGGLTFPSSMRSQYSVDPGVDGSTLGSAGLRLASVNGNINIDALLGFEERRSKTRILQTNRIVVQDNRSGSLIGGQTDYFVPRTSGNTSTEGGAATASATAIQYNLSIRVTPHIAADGAVQMDLAISSSVPTTSANSTADARTTNREVTTTLLKQSGETAVIGGLWDSKEDEVVSGIPIISWLPIIGPLFRRKQNTKRQLELLILITPKILNTTSASGGDKFRMANSQESNLNSAQQSENYIFGNENTNNVNNSNTLQSLSQYQQSNNQVNNFENIENNINNSNVGNAQFLNQGGQNESF